MCLIRAGAPPSVYEFSSVTNRHHGFKSLQDTSQALPAAHPHVMGPINVSLSSTPEVDVSPTAEASLGRTCKS